MTEFEKGYEQGFNDGRASAALPNINDNGDKIDGYFYMYKTDSRGEPYIHIDSVRDMLKKATDVQPVKHGKWSKQGLKRDGFGGFTVGFICSACKEFVPVKGNYCPNCGARMDGDTE